MIEQQIYVTSLIWFEVGLKTLRLSYLVQSYQTYIGIWNIEHWHAHINPLISHARIRLTKLRIYDDKVERVTSLTESPLRMQVYVCRIIERGRMKRDYTGTQ